MMNIQIPAILFASGLISPSPQNWELPSEFPNLSAMNSWIKGGCCGGKVQVFQSGRSQVAFLRWQPTSGLTNCIAGVYRLIDGKWIQAIKLRNFFDEELVARQEGDTVILTFSLHSHQELMRFSISSLCNE